jgi:hypothetical protein
MDQPSIDGSVISLSLGDGRKQLFPHRQVVT